MLVGKLRIAIRRFPPRPILQIERGIQRYVYEKRQENFKNLVSEKEADPRYSELVREYWDIEARIKQYALRQDNTKQVGTDEKAFRQSFHDIRPLSSRSFEIQMQILNLYYNDIMREES